MDDYNLSLAGGIIGFIIVFLFKTKNQKNLRAKYLDIILPSFFIAGIIGFIGAFVGGQIYGTPSNLFFAVDYNTKYSTIPGKLFPLAAIYSIICMILTIISVKLSKKDKSDGYVGYMLMGGLGAMLFFGEFFSWAPDMFEIFIRINQLIGLGFILMAILWIIKFFRS